MTLSRSILPSSSSITSYEPSSDKSSIEQVFSPEEKVPDDTLSNDSSFKCDTGEKRKLIKIKMKSSTISPRKSIRQQKKRSCNIEKNVQLVQDETI